MVEFDYVAKLFRNIVSRTFARYGNNHFMLRFGRLEAVVCEGKPVFIRNGRLSFDRGFFIWRRRKGTMYIYPKDEPNPHIVISGMSGFGKSTLFKSLLLDIRKAGVSCIVFDAHNEHENIVRSLGGKVHNAIYSGINVLELDGASVSERISELTRIFKSVYSLGYIQTTKLSECLWYTYRKSGARGRYERSLPKTPSVGDLIDELNIFVRNSKSVGERNTLLHLRDRLALLNSSTFAGGKINIGMVRTGLHSFSLANMKSKEAQVIYIGELLNRLYASMHDGSKSNSPNLYIMIDEAQFLIDNSNNDPVIAKLIEEGRKYGIGVIIVAHAASTLNRKIMANCATFATFYAREPSEVNYIARVLSGSNPDMANAIRRRLGSLSANRAILVSGAFRNPVLISTPGFDEVMARGAGRLSESEVMDLLRSRARCPIRYEELESIMPVDNRGVISKLVGLGFVDRFSLNVGGKLEEWIMLHRNNISIEHEVLVRMISSILSSNGIHNQIIDNSNGPDILVIRNGGRLAIEYETGSKKPESTRKMIDSRISKYGKVVIVTNDSVLWHYKNMFAGRDVVVVPASDTDSIIGACMA